MLEPFCVLCPVYHPSSERHAPDRFQTCPYGRRRLERDRLAVLSMFNRLDGFPGEQIVDDRVGPDGRPRDMISLLLPMAVTPSASKKPSVSGSKERQLPINVQIVDLMAPATWGPLKQGHDQVGVISVATMLAQWIERWQALYEPDSKFFAVYAGTLMNWIGYRLERFADHDPNIDMFAEGLLHLKSQLRTALGEQEPKPIVMWGVPCRRCDQVSTLVLDPEDPDYYRECSDKDCGLLMTEDDYKAWLIEVVEGLRKEREDVAAGAEV